jgi:hypothetical protein
VEKATDWLLNQKNKKIKLIKIFLLFLCFGLLSEDSTLNTHVFPLKVELKTKEIAIRYKSIQKVKKYDRVDF